MSSFPPFALFKFANGSRRYTLGQDIVSSSYGTAVIGTTFGLLTEGGDFLVTETGDFIEIEHV